MSSPIVSCQHACERDSGLGVLPSVWAIVLGCGLGMQARLKGAVLSQAANAQPAEADPQGGECRAVGKGCSPVHGRVQAPGELQRQARAHTATAQVCSSSSFREVLITYSFAQPWPGPSSSGACPHGMARFTDVPSLFLLSRCKCSYLNC